jgi:hypothetical protein
MRTLALALCILSGTWAQTLSLNNGLRLRLSTEDSSLTPDLAPATGNSFYRIFRDFNNLAVFAYELQVDRSPDGKQFQITAKPALDDFATKFPNADGGKPTPTLTAPDQSAWLSSGERFVVNIPINPGENGGNLRETIDVRIAQGGPGAPADNLVNGRLRLIGLKVSVGGTQVSARGTSAAVGGRYVMFYIPGRGAYYLSTEPVDILGFVEAGFMEGNGMRFTVDNENLEATALESIGRGQLWVFHDKSYKPQGSWTNSTNGSSGRDEFFTAGTDSLKWWLH